MSELRRPPDVMSRGRYLFGVLRAFFAFLSMKRGVLVDKSQNLLSIHEKGRFCGYEGEIVGCTHKNIEFLWPHHV